MLPAVQSMLVKLRLLPVDHDAATFERMWALADTNKDNQVLPNCDRSDRHVSLIPGPVWLGFVLGWQISFDEFKRIFSRNVSE